MTSGMNNGSVILPVRVRKVRKVRKVYSLDLREKNKFGDG
jgi:hypothetical protein